MLKHNLPDRKLQVFPYLIAFMALLGLALTACTGDSNSEPEPTTSLPPPEVLMGLDSPEGGEVELPLVVSGWALNKASLTDTGVNRVQVLDGGCDGAVVGIAEYGLEREDIAEAHGEQFVNTGWQFEIAKMHSGDRILAARVFADGSDIYDACLTAPITIPEPSAEDKDDGAQQ